MNSAEYKALIAQPKRTKHNAKKTTVDGIVFDSKREADRYCELKMLQKVGKIRYFLLQPRFQLPGGTSYRADFLIVWNRGGDNEYVTIEDVKGWDKKKNDFHRTTAYIKARKQVMALYPITIEEV